MNVQNLKTKIYLFAEISLINYHFNINENNRFMIITAMIKNFYNYSVSLVG